MTGKRLTVEEDIDQVGFYVLPLSFNDKHCQFVSCGREVLVLGVNTQIYSQRTRLLAILHTFALSASIGSLMRQYQQLLKIPEEIDVTSDPAKVAQQSVELRQFSPAFDDITKMSRPLISNLYT